MEELIIPALAGTEKQIAWADTIRKSYVTFYQKTRPSSVVRDVTTHTDAKWWIENRYGMGVTNADQREIQKLWKTQDV